MPVVSSNAAALGVGVGNVGAAALKRFVGES
jgi:hypothetical protein